jgi:multidrug efflux system membrane fusion protein
MSKNIVSASLVVVALALWMGSGLLRDEETAGAQTATVNADTNTAPVAPAGDYVNRVRVSTIAAEMRTRHVVLRGRTESKRMVDVKAEIIGTIVSRPVERGMQVDQGDLLCEIAVEDREAALQEARAALQTARIEHEGSLKLKDQGLLSDVAIANSEARQEAAEAHLHRQQLNLARTRIEAPFAGVVENLQMNIGDYATAGATCATLIDLNPMLVVAQVTEAEVENLSRAQTVSGLTINGRRIEGTVSFVGKQSDPATRTYPVEITVDNDDYSLRSGLTVTLQIGIEQVPAHQVSPSLLTLDDDGALGLHIVDASNTVAFKPVEIIEESPRGMWITGLPSMVNLITVGQQYVAVGDVVEPVFTTRLADQIVNL